MDKVFLFKHAKKYWHLYFLATIVIVAIFIHFIHFSSNLLFRADQARDSYYAKKVFDNGISSLRLLGPKVDLAYIEGDLNPRGDTLNLGPFYYYIQVLFVLIFRNASPWVVALPDSLFFVFSIPLFFYLVQHFFSRKNSLLITALFAFSFFNLMYSVFNWNPNQLFFWEILLILGVFKLKTVNVEEKKERGLWFIFTVLSFLVISQLHFVALSGFMILIICFLPFLNLFKIPLKFWVVVFSLVAIFHIPMIVSEIKNHGDNSKRFLVAITREQKEDKSFSKRISKTYNRFGEFFALNLTSFNEREVVSIEKYGAIFFVLSVLFLLFIFIKNKSVKLFKEQKNLSIILLVWVFSFFLIFFRIYGKLDNMRYFITISPLLFIIIGVWFSLLEKLRNKNIGNILIVFVSCLLLFFNFQAIYAWQSAINNDNRKIDEFAYNRNLKLGPHEELITYGQMNNAFNYIANEARSQNKKVCLRNANYQYNLGFEFIKDLNYSNIVFSRFSFSDAYSDCLYFFTGRSVKGEKDLDKEIYDNFKIKESRKFGSLIVWELELRDEIRVKNEKREEEKLENEERFRAETWGELSKKFPYILSE